ncbi:excinuclease ABC, A subunit [Chthoniobacter flavus Ellin428]|uniref:UvrABC system protein A n=1 Tax=Chthoniobacter flavus Ellin428 TaxID=497964 RepID=B4CUG1_9BACT|nr:excinuclease ABC subunit UvrA [Chthoniobacter flavus]EDY22199.1 excinuclease ABC, A subunit [Chthoniobacter flavus Ellin428]TCO94773.1 excinuclease ABC subunit A [Chthoniobacter flavus]
MPAEVIRITGARQHNLRNLTLEIPREKLVVITGMSGSGKSSLAFDTLYAEGQRRYVESLSAYARQFLDQMQKPDVDFIEGLSPAIAIEQRSSGGNPRSTIATTTEIYDYLRLLYSSIGQPHDPSTGAPISKLTPQQIVDQIVAYPAESRIVLLAPLVQDEVGEFRDVIEKLKREGFVRVRVDGEIIELGRPEPIRLEKGSKHRIEVVVDRLVIREGVRTRLADSVDTALKWGGNRLAVLRRVGEALPEVWDELKYSIDYSNPNTGFTLPQLTPKHFSFNSHFGACPMCHGLGTELVCDAELMIPDQDKSLTEGAVAPWAKAGKRMQGYYSGVLESLAKEYRVSMEAPYRELPEKFQQALCFGTGERVVTLNWGENGKRTKVEKPFDGLVASLQNLYDTTESEFTRQRIRQYMSRRTCSACQGARLKPEILAVTIRSDALGDAGLLGERNIHGFCQLTIADAGRFIEELSMNEQQRFITSEVRREIAARLAFLVEVGLGYLSLDRESGTLSGGEAQRIRLATQIGSGLAGCLYVLDEPSIGLHQRDNDRLIGTLRRLRDLGNSVIVVEHDEDTIRAADHILDLGPGAGARGGQIVAQGNLEQILAVENSLTGQYLGGRTRIPVPRHRKAPQGTWRTPDSPGWLTLRGATENNLREVTAAFPLGCLTCVTGVSGSGKSTLVDDILRRALFRHFYRSKERPGKHTKLHGLEQIDKAIVIDQTPIGRTPRSNPATYTGAFGPIRELFANLPASRIRGYDGGRFSFNVKGGRCEACEGDGMKKIEMHFLADVYVECEVCRGRRYNRETLEITYKGKNIADVLDMTVDEAARFFRNVTQISDKLLALEDVGLGYVHLGQSGTTLSGGEAQRIKLATELAKKATGRTVYILDEPTTGLHFADIHKLLEVLMKLRDSGNTLIIIEHNLEVIKCADWVLDMGPEGGSGGGQIVAQGPPEKIAGVVESHTGRYLQRML